MSEYISSKSEYIRSLKKNLPGNSPGGFLELERIYSVLERIYSLIRANIFPSDTALHYTAKRMFSFTANIYAQRANILAHSAHITANIFGHRANIFVQRANIVSKFEQ